MKFDLNKFLDAAPPVTAHERAVAVRNWWVDRGCIEHSDRLVERIERQIKAAERAALKARP